MDSICRFRVMATLEATKKFNRKAGFDVEDYHPREVHNQYLQKLARKLMKDVLPKMDYILFPSPLITEAVKNFGLEAAKQLKWRYAN